MTRCGTANVYLQTNDAVAVIMARYVDLDDRHVHDTLLAKEQRNLGLFGYGAKGMALSGRKNVWMLLPA